MKKIIAAFLGLLAVCRIEARAQDGVRIAARISATQEDEHTICVVVPGQFEITFTKRKGFGATWFDLARDPQRKHDLAPVSFCRR